MVSNTLKSNRLKIDGMTQAQLAEFVGITVQHYQRIEYGKSLPSVTLALRIAAALGVSVEDLYPLPREGQPKITDN